MAIFARPLHWLAIATTALAIGVTPTPAAPPEAQGKAKVFRAGAATSNITPRLGRLLVGGFIPAPSTQIHDEMRVRCLVLDDGSTKLAIVVCDSLGIGREVYDQARRLITKDTGIPGENVLMSATHTHSGPLWSGENDGATDYPDFLARRIADGVARANQNLEPAEIGWGVAQVPGQVFNRRWRMKPGPDLTNPFGGTDTVRMNPPRMSPNLIEPAGPTDPDVSFISVRSKPGRENDRRPIALFANYSLHYVGGTGRGHVSSDYFAMFADTIQQHLDADRLDPPFVGAMSNGTSGDINNINFQAKSERQQPYEQMRKVADEVAAAVAKAHEAVKFRDWVPLAADMSELTLDSRKPTAEQLAWAKATLDKPESAPQYHRLERIYAGRVMKLADAPDRQTIVVQTVRIGDLGIAAIPFEVFVEIGLDLKKRSPFERTFTVSLANGWGGYLPTPAQHKLGGYETWLGTNRVEVEASDKITERLMNSLQKLAGQTVPNRD